MSSMMNTLMGLFLLLSLAAGQAFEKNPVELGEIKWRRGFEAALEEAKKQDKSLLVLFQEVPG
jgi:hypothetical protein